MVGREELVEGDVSVSVSEESMKYGGVQSKDVN